MLAELISPTQLMPQSQADGAIEKAETLSVFPTSIDVNPTAHCNLNCSFCWGPDHSIPDKLTTDNWKQLLDFFAQRGTTSVVFTGGEPLVRKDIGDLLRYSDELGMRVTLSTNGLLLARKADDVLPHINEIGIPLDGSTPERNSKMRLLPGGMRRGSLGHFDAALSSMALVRARRPEAEITARTVASRVNQDDLIPIGRVLSEHLGDVDRWKVYQFMPVSIGAKHRAEHELFDAEFKAIGENLIRTFPDMRIQIYPASERIGRYLFVGPEGNLFGVGPDGKYENIGNFFEMSEAQLSEGITRLVNPVRNAARGHDGVIYPT